MFKLLVKIDGVWTIYQEQFTTAQTALIVAQSQLAMGRAVQILPE